MSKPVRAGDAPIATNLVVDDTYYWCSCGLSKNQPFCDGSHQSTSLAPTVFKPAKSGEHYLCVCKESSNAPYCDGSHNK